MITYALFRVRQRYLVSKCKFRLDTCTALRYSTDAGKFTRSTEIALEFREAAVLGLDLAPIIIKAVPPNCEFHVHDKNHGLLEYYNIPLMLSIWEALQAGWVGDSSLEYDYIYIHFSSWNRSGVLCMRRADASNRVEFSYSSKEISSGMLKTKYTSKSRITLSSLTVHGLLDSLIVMAWDGGPWARADCFTTVSLSIAESYCLELE